MTLFLSLTGLIGLIITTLLIGASFQQNQAYYRETQTFLQEVLDENTRLRAAVQHSERQESTDNADRVLCGDTSAYAIRLRDGERCYICTPEFPLPVTGFRLGYAQSCTPCAETCARRLAHE